MVLNSNPQDLTSLTADEWNPCVQHDAVHLPDFEEELQRRTAARLAFVKADSDARIRRALLRRHRVLRVPLAVGQQCFYWRDAGAPRLQKVRWRGPAKVAMREDDEQGKPITYWIVHATSLIRVAPEHLRPVSYTHLTLPTKA